MLNKNLSILFATCAMALMLSGCGEKEAEQAVVEETVEVVTLPPAGSPPAEWKKYLGAVVMQNMQGVKSNRPYMYFVPGGDDGKAVMATVKPISPAVRRAGAVRRRLTTTSRPTAWIRPSSTTRATTRR